MIKTFINQLKSSFARLISHELGEGQRDKYAMFTGNDALLTHTHTHTYGQTLCVHFYCHAEQRLPLHI